MNSELRKIKSFCKTPSQMRAFNHLVSTFADNKETWVLVTAKSPKDGKKTGDIYLVGQGAPGEYEFTSVGGMLNFLQEENPDITVNLGGKFETEAEARKFAKSKNIPLDWAGF